MGKKKGQGASVKSEPAPAPSKRPAEDESDSEPELPSPPKKTGFVKPPPRVAKKLKTEPAEKVEKEAPKKRDDDSDEEIKPPSAAGMDLEYVEFEINALKQTDFHGIKYLLQQLFWKDMNEHLSEWADVILSQWEYVGSVLKVAGADDVFGMITAINMHLHKDKECVKELRRYLLQKADNQTREKLQSLFDDESKGLGLILNERFMNIPFQLVGPLHTILHDEIKEAIEEDGEPFEFDNYLIISKTYKETQGPAGGPLAPVAKNKKKKKGTGAGMSYVNPEDEQAAKLSTLHYHFGIDHSAEEAAKASLGDQYVLMGRDVMVLPKNRIPVLITAIEDMTER
eukprot:comp9550_c0_seq1/m.4571 comp9550_c0_seq1/g.4571  ORF comp9550_c0_seq1/g.4571 comp9550_c0_seq1/m.4571 type:complete len:341 (-) comp9550_c0_seq1:150-1172(-)